MCLLAIALIFSLFSTEQPQYFDPSARAEYIVRHYTTEDGLPLNAVIRIVQAADGFLYLATLDGLVRYDGYEFEVFTTDLFPELGSNRVQNIGIDDSGLIWLGSTYGIVSSFDGNRFRSFNPDHPHPFNLGQRILPQFRALGTERGIILHEHREPARTRFVPQLNSEVRVSTNQVHINGKLVLETPDIMGGFADQEGTIWIYTFNAGLYHVRRSPVRNITTADSLPVQNIYSIIELPEGDILAGSLPGGSIRFQDSGVKRVRVDYASDHLNQGRFLYYDEAESRIYKSFFSPRLWMYEEDSWVQQLWFHELAPGVDSRVDIMHRAANGKLFIGSPVGMLVKDGDTVRYMEDLTGYNFRFVRVIRELEDGTLFFGTNGNGLYRLNPDLSWHRFTTESGLPSNFIRDIYVEDDTTLWLATEDHGLTRLIFDDAHALISTIAVNRRNGLISNALHRIIPDPYGNLWINSNSGIMRLSRAQLQSFLEGSIPSVSPLILDERNGLVNREGNGGVGNAGLMLRNGLIAFPNQAGIVLINPSEFLRNEAELMSQPLIKRIQTNTGILSAHTGGLFRLPRGDRDFQVHYSLPNFQNPRTLNFSYQLIGFDRQPQFNGTSRTAYYTNVPPGDYLFHVTATGFDGQFAEISIPVIVPPYFYETALFYFFCGVAFLLLLTVLYKQRVKALKTRQERLSALVEERTRDLNQANAEIRQAAIARNRLFSSISHDLKTPLSLIAGPLEEVSDHPAVQSDPDLNTYVNLIRDNSFRLRNLVDQILEATKLNADVLKLQFKPADLVQLTHMELSRLADHARNRRVNIRLTAKTSTIPVYMDSGLWERVLTNLVFNALRFSPVNSEIRVHLEPRQYLIFCTISDQGPGIPKSELSRIFDYLYQGSNSQQSDGTGLGLYLVKGLIERAGGSVRAYNHEKGGAVFEIRLKYGTAHLHPNDVAEPPQFTSRNGSEQNTDAANHNAAQGNEISFLFGSAPSASPGLATMKTSATSAPDERPRILLTEDNHDFRTFLVSVLERHFEISEASNGHEALQLMQAEKPDLVISDVMMPGMDGLTLVKKIRSMPGFENLPVLFISAKDQQDDIISGLSSGADVYLTKPVSPEVVRKQVHAMLRRKYLIQQIPPNITGGPIRPEASETGEIQAKTRLSSPAEEDTIFGNKVKEIILRHLGNASLSTQLIADSLYLSRSQLYRKWEKIEDLPLNKYITKVRIEEACQLMSKEGYAVAEAARAVGYQHASYFSTLFRKETGMPPSEWLQKNGERVGPFPGRPY